MRIGVSIMTGEHQHVWSNGLVQNIYHFAKMLRKVPFVEEVFLLNCGDKEHHPAGIDEEGRAIPLVWPADVADTVDVAIELGGAVSVEWMRRLRRRGGKAVLHLCGQPYVAIVEPTVFKREGFFLNPERFDEVWVLAKDMIFAPMMETMYRCPIRQVPYLWSPRFLEETYLRDEGGQPLFGYTPGSLRPGNVNPAIFEPNLSPIKMGLVPIMICEALERQRPDAIGRLIFHNTDRMMSHASFVHLMQNMKVYQNGKCELVARDYFAHAMGRGKNVVISHQINCPQNYLYLDALHGGYPLIHNSPMFKDLGYYYPDCEVAAGAEALARAIDHHDLELDAYRARARQAIDALSPTGRDNVGAYARLLTTLVTSGDRRRFA